MLHGVRTYLNPSGGLLFHGKALFSKNARWRPFRERLGAVIGQHFQTRAKSCVLVGPSAGYCLNDEFFARFGELLILEPDALARYRLQRRLHRLGIVTEFVSQDLLIGPLLASASALPELLRARPNIPIVFCNILGQVRFLVAESRWEDWEHAFRTRVWPELAGRPWLSFHDRISGSLAPDVDVTVTPRALDNDEIIARFYARTSKAGGELLDHLTSALFSPDQERAYLGWELQHKSFHLIEVAWSNPT